MIPRGDGREDLRVGQGDRHPTAFGAAQNEADPLASFNRHPAAFDRADADLGPLEIEKNADGAADILLKGPNGRVNTGMVLVRSVAEVEPEGVDARKEERLEHLGRGACRPHGGDDLGTTVTAHRSFGRISAASLLGASGARS